MRQKIEQTVSAHHHQSARGLVYPTYYRIFRGGLKGNQAASAGPPAPVARAFAEGCGAHPDDRTEWCGLTGGLTGSCQGTLKHGCAGSTAALENDLKPLT